MFELSEVAKPGIREAMVGHFRHIDEGLTHRIATGLALARMPVAPSTAARVLQLDPSLALQPRVSTGINLHVLAYNLKRAMNHLALARCCRQFGREPVLPLN